MGTSTRTTETKHGSTGDFTQEAHKSVLVVIEEHFYGEGSQLATFARCRAPNGAAQYRFLVCNDWEQSRADAEPTRGRS